jgi:hypothetical protein
LYLNRLILHGSLIDVFHHVEIDEMELNINDQLLNDKYLLKNDFHFLFKKMFAIVYKIYLLISILNKK